MSEQTNRVLIVDYGGVLGEHHQLSAESELARLFRTDIQTIRGLLSEKSEHGCAVRESRITETEFWNRVADLSGIPLNSRPKDSVLSTLWAKTYKIDEKVYSVLSRFRGKVPLGVLTNIDKARSEYLINEVGICSKVDFYFPSYRFGAIKPKPQIWRCVTDELQSNFDCTVEIIYVDDRQSHVKAAGSFGWKGIVYENAIKLEQALDKLHLT